MLLIQSILFTLIGAVGAAVPLLIGRQRGIPLWLLPLATGVMIGLCGFGLLPEVLHEGGRLSAEVVLTVAVVYSIIHLLHVSQHAHLTHDHTSGHCDHHHEGESDIPSGDNAKPLLVFFCSILLHSLFDGALLVISNNLVSTAFVTVIFSLAIHKLFEAMSVSSIVLGRRGSVNEALPLIGLYLLSFPCGVVVATVLKLFVREELLHPFALVVMAAAIGNLVSCLLYDFVLPSLRRFRQARAELAWLAFGIAAAAALLSQL
jgi:zinc transporter ZupT